MIPCFSICYPRLNPSHSISNTLNYRTLVLLLFLILLVFKTNKTLMEWLGKMYCYKKLLWAWLPVKITLLYYTNVISHVMHDLCFLRRSLCFHWNCGLVVKVASWILKSVLLILILLLILVPMIYGLHTLLLARTRG